MDIFSTSLVIMKTQIKTAIKYPFMSSIGIEIKMTENTIADEDVEWSECSQTVDNVVNCINTL